MGADPPSLSRELRPLQLAVGVYVFVFAIKLVAYFMTGVLALLVVRDFKDELIDLYAIAVHRVRWEAYRGIIG